MKKFAETVNKNGGVFLEARHRGKTTYEIQGLTSSPLIIFGGWISPEDHQSEVDKRKQQYEDHQEIYSKTAKKLNEAELELSKLKSQLEKQQPEIPEVPPFVAELIKKRKGNWSLFGAFRNISGNKYDNEKLYEWVFAHAGRQEIFAQAWLNGYTVAKEKRFYLKHKSVIIYKGDRGEPDVDELYLMADGNFAIFKEDAYKFTQQEINSINTGSYEQIEVEE